MPNSKPVMSESDIEKNLKAGHIQCIVEAMNDGDICWDESDTREREPVHEVKKGDLFWCWRFKSKGGFYTHEYANMSGPCVTIKTNVKLELIYVTEDADDPNLLKTDLSKGPNIT